MNHPLDISMNKSFAAIVGFTQEELETNCAPYIASLCKEYDMSNTQMIAHIKGWYNGFSWDGQTRLYSPASVLTLFKQKAFTNYWFSNSTPSFLVNIIKKRKQLPDELEGLVVSNLTGGSMNYQKMSLYPLLFHTGYLTIEKVIRDGLEIEYQLNFPNREVRQSFHTFIKDKQIDGKTEILQA